MTFEEYLVYDTGDRRAEWVDGELVYVSPTNAWHQFVLGFLHALLLEHIERHDLGILLMAGFVMRLETRPSGREPDLLFLAKEHADRLRDTYLDGPADLAVEIVSPDSVTRDHREKLAEYEAAGVREYWVIDVLTNRASFYLLGEDGRFALKSPDDEGWYESQIVAGFRLRVAWLWQRPLPTLAAARAEMQA